MKDLLRTGPRVRSCSLSLLALTATTLLTTTLVASSSARAQLLINEAVASNVEGLKDDQDKTSDWIELFNSGTEPVDLSGYGLSDDPSDPLKWVFPDGQGIGVGRYKLVFASGRDVTTPDLHTNFKLSATGETLVLSDPTGIEIDRLETGRLFVDRSIGRDPAAPETLLVFGVPTPEAENTTTGYAEFVDSFELSQPSGFYEQSVVISLLNAPAGADLYYTLDGSEPTEESLPWPGSLVAAEDVNVVRVRGFEDGKWPSQVATASYFLNPEPNLPVLSLVLNPDDLDELYDNIFAENEVPMHVDLIEQDGTLAFSVDLGAELFGFGSRFNAQKSFQLKPRGGYKDSVIEYQIFPDRDTNEFRRLILRNSGNDFVLSQLRDATAQGLVNEPLFNSLAYRPAVTYVNGGYWGMYNMREHHDVFYTETYHGEDTIDMLGNGFLQSNAEEIEGDSEHYDALLDFLDDNNMAVRENYEYVQTQMDTDQFSAYQIVQIFVANTDWPNNNIKYWRPKREGGRWQWLLFDTDFGLGFSAGPDADTLDDALSGGWPTEVLRALVDSPIFVRDFVNRYADYLNTRFDYSVTRPQLLEKASRIAPEIVPHFLRWDEDPATWREELREVNDFLRQRVDFAREHINNNFDLGGPLVLSLDAEPPGSGQIQLTAITPELPFTGVYFKGIAIGLTAIPANGFAFAGWSDPTLPQEASIRIGPDGDYAVSALFTPGSPAELVINEINYNSSDTFAPGDWVELHNPGDSPLDLSGYRLKDDQDDQEFTFADGTVLAAGDYLVVAQDLAQFEALFPEVSGALGDLGFGLGGGGDQVRAFDPQGTLVDLVAYDDQAPWPTEPDGNGPTLELTDPAANNNDGTNWVASEADNGTPGAANGS